MKSPETITIDQAEFIKALRIDKGYSYTSVAIIFSKRYDDSENPDYEYGRELCNKAREFFRKQNLNWNTVDLK